MKHFILALSIFAIAACGGANGEAPAMSDTPAVTPTDDVSRAIEISNAIRANVAATDSVLQSFSITKDSLDALLYRIAADPAKSARYSAGLR